MSRRACIWRKRLDNLREPCRGASFLQAQPCHPRQIIGADKSRSIQHSPANHDRDARHGIYYRKIFSNAVGEDFLVLEVLFERNAARHDGGELHVIHKAAAGLGSEILFHNLFRGPADSRG